MCITLAHSDKPTQCVSIIIRDASKMIYLRTVQDSEADNKDENYLTYLH